MFLSSLFDLQGRGTVVTGRVEQGTIKTGEDVEILGLTQVRSFLLPEIEYVIQLTACLSYFLVFEVWIEWVVGLSNLVC